MKKDLIMSELNDIYGTLLTPHQSEIIKSYYDYDLSLAEIAQNNGVSRQAIRDVLVKAGEQLVAYEQKLGILKNTTDTKERAQQALECLKNGNTEGAKQLLEAILREL